MSAVSAALVYWMLSLLLAPLLFGIINRTKAFFAGRRGQPWLQTYYDLWKLFHKGTVYSRTTGGLFRSGPVVGAAAMLTASWFVPLGGLNAPLAFTGDWIFVVYLFGLMRFFTVLAALDTGSAFEGMGASREVWISALAEPALVLSLAVLARATGRMSLSQMLPSLSLSDWKAAAPVLGLAAAALGIILLAENARIPVDDPNTHLELTMIHEAMILDHGGPDLGLIVYASALKLWLLGSLLVGVLLPVRTGSPWLDGGAAVAGLGLLAVGVGAAESCMARLRLTRVPQLLVGAVASAALALMLALTLR